MMGEHRHSLAPWNVVNNSACLDIVDANGGLIANVDRLFLADPFCEGNAVLMAASPLLLAALEMVQRMQNKGIEQTTDVEWDDLKTAVDEAIKAAKGEVD